MFLVLEGSGHDQEALQALLQEHGYAVSLQSNPGPGGTGLPQRAEQHAHCICDNGHLGIFRSSLDGQLLSINLAGARMFKYDSPQEMIETVNRTGILEALYVDSSQRLEILAATFSSDDWHVCEEQFHCKDGSVIDCNFHIRAVRDADGRPVEMEGFYEDISERKETERALQRTQITVDKTSDHVFWINPEGRFFYVNEAACASLGYAREELLAMSVFDIDPDFSEKGLAECWGYIKSHGTLTHERKHRARDGRIYPVEVHCNYVNFDGQEFCFSFATDISERKQRDEALRFTQFAVDKTSDQAFWITPEGRFFYANEAACAALGYSRAELEGLAVWDIDPYVSPENAADYWRQLKEKGSMRFETLHRARDGRSYPVEVRGNYVNFDGKEYSCAFATDISERKQTEQQLRQASLIVENSPVVLFRWEAQPGWPVEVVTKNVIRFGYTPEELLSGVVSFSSLVHPDDLERVAAEVQAYTSSGVEHFQQEYRIITKEEDVRWIDDRTFVERDAQGEATHYQGIVIDITERKRTERIMTARMRLLQFAATHTLDELLEATLDEMEELTGSQIGFFHFLEADQKTLLLQNWSTRTKPEFCKAQGKGHHYDLAQAGVWVDCIHERRPVIQNDYPSHPHRKGLPPGHAPLIRELAVPVFRGEKIVAIFAVGNKPQGYTPQDVEMVSLLADLTWEIVDRKQAEEALRESEHRYRSIVEHAPFGITRATRDGKLISVNPALSSILKYDSAQELLETVNRSSIHEVLFPDPSEWASLVKQIFANDAWSVFNNRLRCKDGSFVTCRVHSRRTLDEDDRTISVESYQENITDQLAAEQALRESEEKFRVLAETSPVAIGIFQGERIIYANPALEHLLGYGAEELYGMKFWDWAHDDFMERVRERGLARLRGEELPGQYETKILAKGGEERYVLVSVGTVEYQGQPAGVVSVIDISERKEAEELMRASLAEKEVLLREIHHRVKNNLQVVSSLLYLQSQRFSDPELQACFLESQSRICSMALAHEQLYQSKNLAEISIKSYVESLVGQLEKVFQSPGQEVAFRLVVEDLPLDIEKVVPCGLLITELLSNAYKHAFEDGQKGQVTISMQGGAGQIELAVADNGEGFPAEIDYRQAKTFGLQLVTALVNQLGGTLEMESNNGTRFQVRFAG